MRALVTHGRQDLRDGRAAGPDPAEGQGQGRLRAACGEVRAPLGHEEQR